MPVLTGIDSVGIQDVVFGSNRLKDVVGASALVARVTSAKVEDDGLLVGSATRYGGDVLLAAGGNAILRFDGPDAEQRSRAFVGQFTRAVYDEAPGVEIAIVHREFQDGELSKALKAQQVDLGKATLQRAPHASLLGLSVTATCSNTGLPAVGFSPLKPNSCEPISRQVMAMSDKGLNDRSKARWREFLKGHPRTADFDFPDELDDLGAGDNSRSLLGVVHVDGNGLGKLITDWLIAQNAKDFTVGEHYKEWSGDLVKVGEAALSAVLLRVLKNASWNSRKGRWILQPNEPRGAAMNEHLPFALKAFESKNKKSDEVELNPNAAWLPIRPVLLGGDDLTFLCDGRIALDLAVTAIRAMESVPVHHLFGEQPGFIKACAGVAIVPHHSPFIRSYELAEQLCQSAKRAARQVKDGASCIDWHLGMPRPNESLEALREREYSRNGFHLTGRPYRLSQSAGAIEDGSWDWLDRSLLDDPQFGLRGEVWGASRNKAKELREVLADGPNAVQAALRRWQIATENLKFVEADSFEDGFFTNGSKQTPLLDALELLDVHLPLDVADDSSTSADR